MHPIVRVLAVVLCHAQNNFVRDCGRVLLRGCLLVNDLQIRTHHYRQPLAFSFLGFSKWGLTASTAGFALTGPTGPESFSMNIQDNVCKVISSEFHV